ncbi:MAG: glycosyltransferase [Geitlerinemataceae cyanobacterium]
MKIIFVSHASSLTGAPKVVFELAKIFASQHEVILATKKDGPLLQQALQENLEGIQYFNINNSHEVRLSPFEEKVETAKAFIRQHQPDLVYVNSVASGEWVVASRLCEVKNIFHVHEMRDECLSLLRVRCATLDIMNYVDLLICVSKDVERDVRDFFDSMPPQYVIVNHFFDCEKILNQAKVEETLPKNAKGEIIDKNQPIVCACGVASHRKGTDIFFETARQLSHLQFLWIGKWQAMGLPENPAEKRYIAEKLDNFFISGEVTNPYFYLNLADLFVLCSREDPQPLIVFEALILGKQTVCFSSSGGSRLILDKYGYVLHGEPSVDRLVSYISQICPAPEFQIFKPGWQGTMQNVVRERYDKLGVLSRFENLIHSIR